MALFSFLRANKLNELCGEDAYHLVFGSPCRVHCKGCPLAYHPVLSPIRRLEKLRWYPEHVWLSINGCTTKWMIYTGKSYGNRWFRGTPNSGNHHVSLGILTVIDGIARNPFHKSQVSHCLAPGMRLRPSVQATLQDVHPAFHRRILLWHQILRLPRIGLITIAGFSKSTMDLAETQQFSYLFQPTCWSRLHHLQKSARIRPWNWRMRGIHWGAVEVT